jgi:ABC-type multidrug transport system fused ATPase/permease subunit
VLVALTLLNFGLTLIALAITPVIGFLAYRYSRISHPVLKEVQQRVADVTTQAEENVVGVRVVKAFGQEQHETERFRAGSERIFRQAVRAARLQALYVPALSALPSLAIAGVLLVGGYEVVHGSLTLGEFFAVNAYLLLLVFPLRSMGMWVGQYQRAMASGERVFEVLDEDRDVVERPGARPLPDGPGELAFHSVGFGYEDGREVLSDIELEIEAGQTVALIGPTGCGKTTLTALIPRFYDVQRGSITLDGLDVRDATLDSLRSAIGIVGQDTFLFSTTVAENIAYGAPGATAEQIAQAAVRAQAHDFIMDLPDGYDTRVGERGLSLSGGQRQRIAIARAVIRNTPILILDEPTSGLDSASEKLVFEALDRLMEGRTVVVIAHRLSTIQRADIIFVVKDGAIVERGKHAELMKVNGVYAELHNLQFKEEEFTKA